MPAPTRVLTRAVASARPQAVRRMVDVDQRVRQPLALTARIGFVAAEPGSGCSAVAGGVARAVAARRAGRVLAVNMSSSVSALRMAGCTEPAGTTADVDDVRRTATSAAQAADALVRTPGGVYCLDLLDDKVPPPVRWWSALGPAARFFDVVVTDWGARTGDDLAAVAASSRVVAVTARADRQGMQRAVDLAAACASLGVGSVVVLVDVAADRTPGVRVAVASAPVPAVLVPHDKALARGRRPGMAWDLAVLESTAAALDVLGRAQRGLPPAVLPQPSPHAQPVLAQPVPVQPVPSPARPVQHPVPPRPVPPAPQPVPPAPGRLRPVRPSPVQPPPQGPLQQDPRWGPGGGAS